MVNTPKTPYELIARLTANPTVLGILRYGSKAAFDSKPGGDLDLFVIVTERPDELESLHFHVGETPVDLNVRTLTDIHRQPPLTVIDSAIADAELLFDRHGSVAAMLAQVQSQMPSSLTEHDIAWARFCQQHLIDKVRGRLESEPMLCALLLNTNIYWLIQTYFRVRLLPYQGEKAALIWIQAHDPKLYELIEQFYATPDLAEKLSITVDLTDYVLESIGGPWKRGELITFGTTDQASDLVAKGEAFFRALIDF